MQNSLQFENSFVSVEESIFNKNQDLFTKKNGKRRVLLKLFYFVS